MDALGGVSREEPGLELLRLEIDLSTGTLCTQSLLQGEQLQERSGKLGKFLAQIDGKLANFDAKWCQNGVWDPFGAKMAPGRRKGCPGHF